MHSAVFFSQDTHGLMKLVVSHDIVKTMVNTLRRIKILNTATLVFLFNYIIGFLGERECIFQLCYLNSQHHKEYFQSREYIQKSSNHTEGQQTYDIPTLK